MTNPFSSPAAPGAPDPAPRPRDLVGCLVAYSPRAITLAGAPGNEKGVGKSEPRDRVTADLIVLEIPVQAVRDTFQTTPGVVMFGGSPDWEQDPRPHHLTISGPARFDGVWVSQENIVKFALAPSRTPLVGQLILGVVERSTFGNRPFNLVDVAGTPSMDRAIQIYTALASGAIQYSVPQPIPGVPVPQKANATPAGPMPPANSVNYGYTPPTPVAPAPVMPPGPPTIPVAAPPPPFDFAAFQAQQAAAALAAAGLQPTPVSPFPGASPAQVPALQAQGWTPETWAQVAANPQHVAQVLASLGV